MAWRPAAAARSLMYPVGEWTQRHRVPASRIVATEFECDRAAPGAREYLEDVVAALSACRWQWAFYTFREDSWAGMDYELGTAPQGAAYWDALERGEAPKRPWRDNSLWRVLHDALRAGR